MRLAINLASEENKMEIINSFIAILNSFLNNLSFSDKKELNEVIDDINYILDIVPMGL